MNLERKTLIGLSANASQHLYGSMYNLATTSWISMIASGIPAAGDIHGDIFLAGFVISLLLVTSPSLCCLPRCSWLLSRGPEPSKLVCWIQGALSTSHHLKLPASPPGRMVNHDGHYHGRWPQQARPTWIRWEPLRLVCVHQWDMNMLFN